MLAPEATIPMSETTEHSPAGHRVMRYAAEFVVIFMGVSLSFFAENLREGRADRVAERESLLRLVRDMESDLADFPGNLERATAGIASIEWIQRAQDGERPSVDSLEHHLASYLVCSAMAANSSEYESLKASGGLRLIRDMDFRQALTANYEGYAYLSELHLIDCESMVSPLDHVAEHVRVQPADYFFEVRVVGGVDGILTNRRFLNELSQVSVRRGAIAARVEGRVQALEDLRGRALELLDGF